MAAVLSISTPSATLTFSDIDSDAAAAILHRTTRHRPTTTTTRTSVPQPGTRRFRRYLNSLVSADDGDGSSSEYYSASEVEREEGDPEIWRNEWRGEFVRAGDEFFEGRVGLPRHDRGGEVETGSRLQRRVKTIERERLNRRRERRERLERKQKRLAAVDQLAMSSTRTAVGDSEVGGVEDGSLASLRAQRDGVQVMEEEFVMVDDELDSKQHAVNNGRQQQDEEEDELMQANVIAGDGQCKHLTATQGCPVKLLARTLTSSMCPLLPSSCIVCRVGARLVAVC